LFEPVLKIGHAQTQCSLQTIIHLFHSLFFNWVFFWVFLSSLLQLDALEESLLVYIAVVEQNLKRQVVDIDELAHVLFRQLKVDGHVSVLTVQLVRLKVSPELICRHCSEMDLRLKRGLRGLATRELFLLILKMLQLLLLHML
jgi:hypothetical protein